MKKDKELDASKISESNKNSAKTNIKVNDEMDELMPRALKIVMEFGKASVSMVQRRLSLGYTRAATIIDQMVAHGFIDSATGNKPHDVKITIEEYENLFGNFDEE